MIRARRLPPLVDFPARWRRPLQLAAARDGWLALEGSVTDALLLRFGEVSLTLLDERTGRPPGRLFDGLGRSARHHGPGAWWLRRIQLSTHGTPRVEALTLIPPDAPCLHRRIRGLGRRPLADVLFSCRGLQPGIRRLGVWARRAAAGGAPTRLTCFSVHGETLYLIEAMPGLEGEPKPQPR